jgi:hypothetical protein
MVIEFKTITGSTYRYGTDSMMWERVGKTGESGHLRTDSGIAVKEPKIEVGEPVHFISKPIKEGTSFRLVVTSEVTEINSSNVESFTAPEAAI